MAEVAKAYVSLLPSTRDWNRQIPGAIGRSTERASRDAGEKAGKAFGGAFGGAVKGIAAVAGVGAVGSFFTDSINKASELQQSVGGVEAVFGRYADSVLADSRRADQALGLSANAYNELITVSAALLKNKGLKDFADQSKNLIAIGADLSAQYGGSTAQAVEALNAAMRGESDPIERYGISLNETAVNSVLAAKGLSDLEGAALDQAKTQARLELITRQSADAAGAFARESDTMAGQQARARAQFENTRAELGEAFLPVMTDLFELANDKVVPAITDFVDGMKTGEGVGGDFADVLGDVKDVAEGVADLVSAIPPDVLKIGVGIGLGAVAVGKLNSAVASSRLPTLVADLGKAETRAAGTSRALQGLGTVGRNVAGAGGMLLLADASNETSESLGALKGAAGGALSGAALGAFAGPVGAGIGAAVGGLAGGLFGLAQATDEAKEAAEIALPPWEDYQRTLEGVAGATTEATREMAFQRLEAGPLLNVMRDLGLSDREAVNAVLGRKTALEKLNTAIGESKTITAQQRLALIEETGAVGQSRLAYLRMKAATAATKEEKIKFQREYDKLLNSPNIEKRIGLSGVGQAKKQLSELLGLLGEVAAASGGLPKSGPAGGLDVLLGNPKRRALGGAVRPGELYKVGERGPEIFTTSQRRRLSSETPPSPSVAGGRGAPMFGEVTVYAQDVNDFLRQMDSRRRLASLDGISR